MLDPLTGLYRAFRKEESSPVKMELVPSIVRRTTALFTRNSTSTRTATSDQSLRSPVLPHVCWESSR